MGRLFLGTSALALVSVTHASAVDWDVRVSGYGEYTVGYASSSVDNVVGEDFDGVDVWQDVEIHFIPSIKLDNGIQFGANVQLEGNTSGDQIDESYVFIKGSFGEVNIGSENSAGYKMHFDAPSVLFFGTHDLDEFIPFSGNAGVNVGDDRVRGTFGQTSLENDRNNDAQRITYYTPRTFGFQLGASYARDALQDSSEAVDTGSSALHDIFDIGVNYKGEFGGVDLGVSARWGIASDSANDRDPQIWSVGGYVGVAGATIGASFAEQNESGTEDGIAYDVGGTYKFGPWGVSLTYFHGENVDDERVIPGGDEELDVVLLGLSYKLAKGVTLVGWAGYADFEEDAGDAGGAGDNVDGIAVGTGIKIKF